MNLIHYSKNPIREINSAKQEDSAHMKPHGLWVSDGTAWKDWCKGENFMQDCFKYETHITLTDKNKILFLNTRKELKLFTVMFSKRLITMGTVLKYADINWTKVAKKYKGLIITPYIWEARHELIWYYGWDVASGCIWDKTAIKEFYCVKCK